MPPSAKQYIANSNFVVFTKICCIQPWKIYNFFKKIDWLSSVFSGYMQFWNPSLKWRSIWKIQWYQMTDKPSASIRKSKYSCQRNICLDDIIDFLFFMKIILMVVTCCFLPELKKKFLALFYGWGSTALRLDPRSSQKFLVLILSTSEGWKAELTLESTNGFEHGTLGLGIQHLSH